ncbi:MAG: 50S ribosomal protein L4 [Nanoarchaeota archaeon]|nr:50S ribosomal protein L4 [Nanoarchaeota archaeon]
MKAQLYDLKGNKKKEIELPAVFNSKVREDIVMKYYEASKFAERHPYAPNREAGKRHSASGTISHRRHMWKGHYGKGISRIPRKTMWRRGTQFFWVGAEVASTRGGRRAHPPKIDRRVRKINKKEFILALNSAFASTANEAFIQKRYASLSKLNNKFPIIIESVSSIKTKDLIALLKSIFGDISHLALKTKSVRSGKGKLRGRKYKSNAGVLLIKSSTENIKMKGIDIKSVKEIKISDLYPLGRLTIYTEKALEELGSRK